MIIWIIIIASLIGIVINKKAVNKEMYRKIIFATIFLYIIIVFTVSSFPSDFQKMYTHLHTEYTKNETYSTEFLQKIQAYNNAVVFWKHYPVDTIVWGFPKISDKIANIPLIDTKNP